MYAHLNEIMLDIEIIEYSRKGSLISNKVKYISF